MNATRRRLCAVLVAFGCAVGVAACGDDEKTETAAATPAASQPADDLQPVKDFLLEHTEQLNGDAAALREGAEEYYALAEAVDFDYAKLLADKRAEVQAFVKSAQEGFTAANPAYEQMEGVVAGVPSLADFDVIIDAGSDGSDPENAAPITLKTPAGKTYEQPGNFNYLIETAAFGTEPKFAAKGVKPDLDDDGKVSFGESLPDADFYVTAAREFEKTTQELDAAAKEWTPDPAGRVHRARRHDADHVRVLRRVEELALRRGRQGRGEGVRRRLAPAGHRRHPRRPADRVRGRRAADRVGRRRPGDPDQAGADRAHGRSPSACATRRPAASSSPPTRPRRWAPRRRPAPRRSPARSPRPPASWTSRSRRRRVRRAAVLTLVLAGLLVRRGSGRGGGRGGAPAWQSAEALRGGLFAAQTELILGDRAAGHPRGEAGGRGLQRRAAHAHPRRRAGRRRRRAAGARRGAPGRRHRRRARPRGRPRGAPGRGLPRLGGGHARRRRRRGDATHGPELAAAARVPHRDAADAPGRRRHEGASTGSAKRQIAAPRRRRGRPEGPARRLPGPPARPARSTPTAPPSAACARGWPSRPRRPRRTGRSSRRATPRTAARRPPTRSASEFTALAAAARAGDVPAFRTARERDLRRAGELHRRAADRPRSPPAARSSCCASSRSCRSSTAAASRARA